MVLDFSRCKLPPFKHQREDVEWLVERPFAFITSEMRTGKTKIVIDAAQFLFEAGTIDRMIVVAPAPVRDVWADPDLGELAKHLWPGLPATITEYHARQRYWTHDTETPEKRRTLDIYVTNFEFLRSKARLLQLLPVCGPKTLLVLDESSFVKSYTAAQTKACLQLRRKCGRVVLLNGTPIFHSPLDLFSQGNILSPSVLECKFITHFRARYAVMGPSINYGHGPVAKINGWTNLDDLERRFAPVTVRRMQKECLDLPPKLDPVTLTATLTDATWRAYREMRDEMVVWLKSGAVATSATAAVKALRLSQITGGFVGGVESPGIEPGETPIYENAAAVGREKLDVLLWFIEQKLEEDPNLKLVAWGRFRAEVFRAVAEVQRRFPQMLTAMVLGGQKRDERLEALALLKPETAPAGPVFVAGIEGTGSFGIDMSAAHTCVTMSSGYSPGRSAQTLDRVYGPGQTHPIAYYDIVAVGPKGQRTIDRDILLARLNGHDVALRTAAAWIKALTDE
jgi:hypothetical protein